MNPFCKKYFLRYEKVYITFLFTILVLSLVVFLLPSCKKKDMAPPAILLTKTSGYVFKDSVMAVGKNFKIELNAFGGNVNLTNIIIRNEHGGVVTNYFDTGINNQAIKISKILTKGVYESEKWTFIAIDKNGENASVSFVLNKDPNSQFGNIRHINATMGAQSSTLIGSFLSLNSGMTFFQDSAFAHQDSIEMLYYYDAINGEANTIASPNANVEPSIYTGAGALTNWTVKNETRYFKTTLTAADFNAAVNDSLLLVAYNEPNAKRKAKNLVAGDIYSFKTTHNKFGLFQVQQVVGQEAGTVTVNILIQQ